MKHLGDVLVHLRASRAEANSKRTEAWRGALGDQTLQDYLRRHYHPALADRVGPRSLQAVLSGTTDQELRDAADRLRLCAGCEIGAPRCRALAEGTEPAPGAEPIWQEDRGELTFVECAPWRDHLLRSRLVDAGVGRALAGASFESFDAQKRVRSLAAERCRRYIDADYDAGKTLLIEGASVGVGKTYLAIAVLRELFARHKAKTALFLNVPRWINELRRAVATQGNAEDDVRRAGRVDVLVLDDLGHQRTTEWVREQIYIVTDERWSNGRPTIVTTNADADTYQATIGPAAMSRLFAAAVGVRLEGRDRR